MNVVPQRGREGKGALLVKVRTKGKRGEGGLVSQGFVRLEIGKKRFQTKIGVPNIVFYQNWTSNWSIMPQPIPNVLFAQSRVVAVSAVKCPAPNTKM